MEVDSEQLLKLTKDLAEGVLKLRIKIQEYEGRIARLEHVVANPPEYAMINSYAPTAPINQNLARPSESILYAQRDIIGE